MNQVNIIFSVRISICGISSLCYKDWYTYTNICVFVVPIPVPFQQKVCNHLMNFCEMYNEPHATICSLVFALYNFLSVS
jgi:hypothetical protein